MSLRKTKKRRKVSRMRGTGTHGSGARKKGKKSGHRGGAGMSGSGKRADHKKTLITKLYGHSYFGKQGITSRRTKKDKRKRINIRDIELNIEKLGKKAEDTWQVNLQAYKILDSSKDYNLGSKLIIKAADASRSVIEKVKKAGGEIILPGKNGNKKEVVNNYKNVEQE